MEGMNIRHLLVVVLFASTACAQERYQINARYSDSGAKKQFSSLGEATVTFAKIGNSEFGIRVHASVKDPRDGKVFEFDVDNQYVAAGTRITPERNRGRYNENAAEYRPKVERVLPFIYLVRFGAPGDERTYHFQGGSYTVRQRAADGGVEASLYEGDELLGKFQLHGGEYQKFRVETAGKIALTFVRL